MSGSRAAAVLILCMALLATTAPTCASAETRRALLVGIDKYVSGGGQSRGPMDRGWTDLDGAVNDAESMAQVLVARYGFSSENIRILRNGEATRDRILNEIRTWLTDLAQPGDIAFFFYAGHGSQVVNSQSPELDRMDESIVPADANEDAPDVKDIRDKELRRLFNEILDRKAILTVIFDSCHSGSVVRGLRKARKLGPDLRDVKDPSEPGPAPEERGALILSAAQDHELAWEARDEEDHPHGALSLALLETLRTAEADESAGSIFLSVKARMQTEGVSQEPVLAGIEARRNGPLLGGAAPMVEGTRVAVLKSEGGRIVLQGGLAIGLREGCELTPAGGGAGEPRLRIQSVENLTTSTAEVLAGDAGAIRAGDLYRVDRWAISAGEALRVWAPQPLEDKELRRLNAEVTKLRNSGRILMGIDPSDGTATHVVSRENGEWQMYGKDGSRRSLGTAFQADAVGRSLKGPGVRIALLLPPAVTLFEELQSLFPPGSTVRLTDDPAGAQYQLVIRPSTGDQFECAWVLSGAMNGTLQGASLPRRTDWIPASDPKAAAGQLRDLALRIARIHGWLALAPPAGNGAFPYRLALRNSKSGEILDPETLVERPVRSGETYGLLLQAAPDKLKKGVERRYVYVFVLDSHGDSTLLFPPAGAGNVENRIPIDPREDPPAEIPLGRSELFRVGPPFGTDTYILLSTAEPIANPAVLAFEGVRTAPEASARGASGSVLQQLLAGIGNRTRGAVAITPSDWSLQRMAVRSEQQ